MEPNGADLKTLKSNSKNSKANNLRNPNAITNKGPNQYIKRKHNKQFQRNYDANGSETRNGSISDRIANTETLSNHSPDFAVFILVLIGNEVELKLANSQVYRGIFHSISTREGSNEQFVCIRFCRRILDLFSSELSKPIEDYCMFPLSSIYRFSTTNPNGVPTRFDSVSGELKGSHADRINTFMTDIEISNSDVQAHERILKPWVADDHNSDLIEDVLGNESFDCWDQFEENRNKFGVQGTYDENLYTTPLDYSVITEEEKRKAEILANEIEKEQKTNSVNNLENEKNDSTIENDEEMHFSSVYRSVPDQISTNKDTDSKLENASAATLDQFGKNDKCMEGDLEISNKDSHPKQGKSSFSFNPNAKEFLPRAISNFPTLPGNPTNNYINIQTHEPINNSCEFQNGPYQYSYNVGHGVPPNGYQYHYGINQPTQNNGSFIHVHSVQSKGSQFRDELNNEAGDETNVNQILCGSYYLIKNRNDEINEDGKGGYKPHGNSCDAPNSQAIYYYPAESGDAQNPGYYVPDYNSGKWQNYPTNVPYYIPNNHPELYNQYRNYQGQGTYY